MAKVEMVAVKDGFVYGGKRRYTGDRFYTPGQTDAMRLKAFKFAEPVPPESRIVVAPVEAAAPKSKRKYQRRDMTAASAAPQVEVVEVTTTHEPEAQTLDVTATADDGPVQVYDRRDMEPET